jgi:hypothetical protein
MVRNIAAAIVGVIVSITLVQSIEMLSHMIYPIPEDTDFSDAERVREFMSTLPVGAILSIGVAWSIGAFGGTLVGAWIATAKPLIYAIIVGGTVLAGTVTMLILLPHPWWFTISAPLGVVVGAYLGMYIATRLRGSPAPT